MDLGFSYETIRQRIPEQSLHKVYTFNSMRKSMTTVLPRHVAVMETGYVGSGVEGTGFRVFTKGAAEIVLQKLVLYTKMFESVQHCCSLSLS